MQAASFGHPVTGPGSRVGVNARGKRDKNSWQIGTEYT
jgi:hypothetical protein